MTPSEQARADAIADAQTLELYFACMGLPPSLLPAGVYEAATKGTGVWIDRQRGATR